MGNMPKCENNYCKYNTNGNCNVDGDIVDNCLYLKAIEEIARLNIDETEIGDWEWWK